MRLTSCSVLQHVSVLLCFPLVIGELAMKKSGARDKIAAAGFEGEFGQLVKVTRVFMVIYALVLIA